MAVPVFEVTDDSGFLGLIDPDAYLPFVGEDWTLEQLFARFRTEMGKRALLLWGTGAEGTWRVEVATGARPPGFRSTAGPIRVTGGRLLLVNYETLTMAAQFADVSLPEPHLADLLLTVPNGDYACEITQVHDPEAEYASDGADFVVALTAGVTPAPWSAPAWFQQTW
ncbi:hypothetical protein [Amycolatopsis sp. CA-230715]|uniref:hypothetical protein n=1 Tax=Amycolatopsis sp. CA-230715 TaxID=2745196 RepID=UPI001C01D763|nr:hypothetical protein [Amycolatopsis sp. CA-230715]